MPSDEKKELGLQGVKFLLPAVLKRHFLWNGATLPTNQKKGHQGNLVQLTIRVAEA